MALTLKVEGMTCPHCVAHVKRALEAVPGVTRASPDLETGLVTIEGRPEKPELLEQAVEQAGYRVARR
ncbi:MAG TPA: heavy metal-associated domain-containing protein [Myxococcota bacterium]|nr:heavy metal-associated domain-containing protein [Myxococcota bacterium]HRY95677.1 heavy metal-associated domain-containing protein [Myxococcota bacterium]HSA24158.1 heavy metal-associated domain-containing protein [Myxococcota bacterium]